MPGTLDSLSRKLIIATISLTGPDQTNVDPTTGATLRTFIAPFTAQIRGIQGIYGAETGTTPQVDFSVRRSTTKLATVTVLSADTPVRAEANAYIEKGETLNIFMDATANADDDFTGILVILDCQVVVDENIA